MSTDWASVYRDAFLDVVHFLTWKLGDEERARDLAQDAFARALPHDPDDPRSFVFRIAGNLARDEARMIVRRKRHLKLVKVEESVRQEKQSTPDHTLARKARAESVQAALAELSDADRDVLLLWNSGLSYGEIAEQTGLAQGSVGTTVVRAKKKLLSAWKALEERDDEALG